MLKIDIKTGESWLSPYAAEERKKSGTTGGQAEI